MNEQEKQTNEMLDELPTCELVEEISRRKGVYEIRVNPYSLIRGLGKLVKMLLLKIFNSIL